MEDKHHNKIILNNFRSNINFIKMTKQIASIGWEKKNSFPSIFFKFLFCPKFMKMGCTTPTMCPASAIWYIPNHVIALNILIRLCENYKLL